MPPTTMNRSFQARKTGESAAGLDQAASRNSRSTRSSSNAKQEEGGRFGRHRASSSGGQAGDRHLSKQMHMPDSIDALDSTLDVIYGQPGQPGTTGAASTRAMMAMHSGPYDAASAHRNRNPASKHAPVGAFTSGLGVVDPVTGTVISGYGRDDGPYAAVARSPPPLQTKSRLPSQESAYPSVRSPTRETPPALGSSGTADSFGTPVRGPVFGPGSSTSNEMKARHHEVMFGVQEGEAYEDFAVGGVVSMDNDRRASLNDAASRSAMAPNQGPSFPPQRMTDMAGTGKGSTYGQGPLRMVDPKDDRDLVNGMNGLGLYGGNQSPGLGAGPAGGLGSSTFLEGTSVGPSRSRDESSQYHRNGKGSQIGVAAAEQPLLNRRPSDQSANKGVRRNKSLVKRLKGMRDNPNTPYQPSDSEPEDNSLKPPSSSYPYDQRPGPGSRSFSAESGRVKPSRSSSQNQTGGGEGERISSQSRARSKSSANPSFQPLGKTRSNAMSAEKESPDEPDPNKIARPSLLSRVTSGRWRRKD